MPSSSDEVATSARSAPDLEQILHLHPLRPRDRTVMRAHERFAGQLVQRAGQPLGQTAAVDEDERRSVRADQLDEPRVDRRPDRRAGGIRRPMSNGFSGSSVWAAPPAEAIAVVRAPAISSTGTSIVSFERLLCARHRQSSRAGTGRSAPARRIRRRCPAPSRRGPLAARSARGGGDPRADRSAPPRNRATSSSGRCVADSPIRCGRVAHSASSRSSDSAKCAPRLVGTRAWISSMMTVSTVVNMRRARSTSAANRATRAS